MATPGIDEPRLDSDPFSNYLLDSRLRRDVRRRPAAPRRTTRRCTSCCWDCPPAKCAAKSRRPTSSFLHQGITFTVYGRDEGTERIFPARPAAAHHHQRRMGDHRARPRPSASPRSTCSCKDIYHEGRCLADGIVPRELVYSCKHFRREMRGVAVPKDIYVVGRGHRPGPAAGWPLRRARRQPARAERRVLHADHPPGHEAHLPGAVPAAPTSGRSITTAKRCWPRCARSRPKAAPSRTSCC